MGSSVVIALAAVLWMVYLIPTWFRRRVYLTTERNAVRLQQTLRILAETAEVPGPVYIEATARSVAAQQRALRQEFDRARAVERAREASMSRAAARTLATLKPAVAAAMIIQSPAAQRLRRSRAATSLLALVSLGVAGAGLLPAFATLPSGVIVGGVAVAAGCVVLLNRMAGVARSRAARARSLALRPAVRRGVVPSAPLAQPAVIAEGWVPVPLPKPLYLSRPVVQELVSGVTLAETRTRLLAEASLAAQQHREVERARNVTPIIRPAAPVSRFATMGIVDSAVATDPAVSDLDDVLRRRRAV